MSATIHSHISASMSTEVMVSPVIFTSGEDTSQCGGSFNANATHVTFTSVPLAVGSNITITQLVNITNTDSSDYDVRLSVTENFGPELSLLSLYLVSPYGTEILIVSINDFGIVTTEGVSVNIPRGEEWLKGRLQWYNDHGCDERGVPTKDTLRNLGLEFTIEEMEKAGAW